MNRYLVANKRVDRLLVFLSTVYIVVFISLIWIFITIFSTTYVSDISYFKILSLRIPDKERADLLLKKCDETKIDFIYGDKVDVDIGDGRWMVGKVNKIFDKNEDNGVLGIHLECNSSCASALSVLNNTKKMGLRHMKMTLFDILLKQFRNKF